ncbi:uncharacterized protein LOC122505445 isoform X2 [Leptopilina heterotoma]|uniref:uncharacterized protein LOC122505445 isoform X2 n=1 Tax=Leptopilina heterotoma TaxID=63436 RepID=UPI001CA9A0D6|nr:uncharacterized protein LOC122505445 isoform X2 [Leptopilina heterotoma]
MFNNKNSSLYIINTINLIASTNFKNIGSKEDFYAVNCRVFNSACNSHVKTIKEHKKILEKGEIRNITNHPLFRKRGIW